MPLYLTLLGATYVLAWSVSFYPQVILNYRRKTASGLSQDFTILNPLGFLAYAIYSLSLTYSPLLRAQYAARNDGHLPQVSPSDIAFALHALVLSSVCLGQTYYYSRKRRVPRALKYQRIADEMMGVDTIRGAEESWMGKRGSREKTTAWTWASLMGIAGALLAGLGAVIFRKWEWLDFVYLISYIKLYISIAKWLPQLLLNAIRRSTTGFSIHVITLDLLGSTTSLAELVLSSLLAHDPRGIIGNPLKLGLSAVTVACDVVFCVQRWVLYPPGKEKALGEGETLDEETPLVR
ncbi:hypothetical protein NCC49_001110 [Naganishia albida]|nr:hypothetical protein NCC49_001110 [Naganishia albida]